MDGATKSDNFRENSKQPSTPRATYYEMHALHMISRDRDHSEGRGVGVNGRLEHFRKFIHFGTLTRPLDWYGH